MFRATMAASLALAGSSAIAGEIYLGIDILSASFPGAGRTSEAIATVLEHEGFRLEHSSALRDSATAPVLGYRLSQRWAMELTHREYAWSSRIRGSVGPTVLQNSTTGGPATTVAGAEFHSVTETILEAWSAGITYSRGRLFAKGALLAARTCSGVFESSNAQGRSPEHVESRSGICRRHLAYALGAGVRARLASRLEAAAFIELIPDVGNDGVVFVDGAGVPNGTLAALGAGLRWSF